MRYIDNPQELYGMEVHASDGQKIGKVDDILLDEATQRVDWAAVRSGMLARKETLVPLSAAELDGDTITVPYDKDFVASAPQFKIDGLKRDEEASLFSYYGVPYGGETATATGPDGEAPAFNAADRPPAATAEPSGTGEDAMTRSEERLHVGVEREEAGRARLHKYVVTENVTKTVPVSHEEVRVEHEPITDENRSAALSGEDITEAEHEVVLHEERPVVEKETVPVERVRLATDEVNEEQEVETDLRKEQVELEEDARSGRRRAS